MPETTTPADNPSEEHPNAAIPLTRVRIELPVVTIVKVLLTLALLWFFLEIRSTLFVLFLGVLVALVFDSPIQWLQQRGVPRGPAITAVLGAFVGVLAALLALVIPPLAEQLQDFWDQLPSYVEGGLAWLQERWPGLYDVILEWAEVQREGLSSGGINLQGLLSQGISIVSSAANLVIMLIVAVYLLADNGRTMEPVLSSLPDRYEDKARRTIPAVAGVVRGYVVGQAINSSLFAIYTFVVLSLLDVPSAIVMALVAAIGDAIPQVGVTLATIPALLLALTVSFETAVIVLVAYVAYQVVENYITSPRIFGETLELAPLVTFVAILIGGSLSGIIGVLLALPVAAAVPVIARIWSGHQEPSDATDETPEEAAPSGSQAG